MGYVYLRMNDTGVSSYLRISHICVRLLHSLLVQPIRAMRRPQQVGRAMVRLSRFFINKLPTRGVRRHSSHHATIQIYYRNTARGIVLPPFECKSQVFRPVGHIFRPNPIGSSNQTGCPNQVLGLFKSRKRVLTLGTIGSEPEPVHPLNTMEQHQSRTQCRSYGGKAHP